ncbi:MAG: hypothetical protein HXX08_10945 [Chloroflexi bacterium]|uniref:Uncharacterized protein n=1 Tax=Candidatus Chlorohelix allophototropha TaxID=3003348 RepID=A0A8T7LWP7_9CHLR|nr:hypothetical protein [Chloroflexota bacterium]WJW65755.1 hypothetical protein OZ401_001533 [Chloroflexota bacterium L227-S17]
MKCTGKLTESNSGSSSSNILSGLTLLSPIRSTAPSPRSKSGASVCVHRSGGAAQPFYCP